MSRNVLLVSLDTLRADVAYSGRFETLARLGRESTRFRTVVSSAPLTPVSHATAFTGRQPPAHGIRHLLREPLAEGVPTLAAMLAGHGYATGAVVSCPGLNRWYGLGRGFQYYDDEVPPLPDGRNGLDVADVKLRGRAMKRAELVTDRALAWLASRPRAPWLLFAHYFDTHWPYEAPERPAVPLPNAYEEEVAYMDRHLGRLLAGMPERGVELGETLVVCFSDHGEDLAGWYANDHAGPCGKDEEEGHGCLLFDATQLVPLWFRLPSVFPGGAEVGTQVRLVDLTPTVLDVLGIPAGGAMDGRSLLPCVRGEDAEHRPAYAETFFREELASSDPRFNELRPLKALRLAGRYKVVWEVGGDRVEVFDLARDPLEKDPAVLCSSAPAHAREDAADPIEDRDVVGLIQRRLEVQPGMRRIFDRLLPDLLARRNLGLAVTGSFAEGRPDEYSDLDLQLTFADPGPGHADRLWVADLVERSATTLSSFPATHLGLPNLLIFFLLVDDLVVKIDLDLRSATGQGVKSQGAIVRRAGPLLAPPPPPRAEPALAACDRDERVDRYRKFVGWIWYTYTKIARGELFEANDSLGVMRHRALVTALRDRYLLPPEGCRRLEAILPAEALHALRSTVPAAVEADALLTALRAMVQSFGDVERDVASRRGVDHRTADLRRMAEQMDARGLPRAARPR